MHANAAQSLTLLAGFCHAAQIPALLLAPRALAWDSGSAITRRIEAVLNWTVPTISITLAALLLVHGSEAFSVSLGQALWLLIAGQWLLLVYGAVHRRMTAAPGRRFAHRRREITFTLLGLGLIVVLNARDVGTTRLGALVCLGLGVLYSMRATLQVFWYRPVWPAGTTASVVHWMLVALFTTQTALYSTVAVRFFCDGVATARVA